MAFQLALEDLKQSPHDEERRSYLLEQMRTLVSEHGERLFGALAPVMTLAEPGGRRDDKSIVSVAFRRGAIDQARIAASATMGIGEVYSALRQLPVAQHLRSLSVGPSVKRSLAGEGFHYQDLYASVQEHGLFERLRALVLGDLPESILGAAYLGDPAIALGQAQHLEALTLAGRHLELSELRLVSLTMLKVNAAVTAATLAHIAASDLPRLTKLSLQSRGLISGGRLSDALVALETMRAPLRSLALRGFRITDLDLDALLSSRLLPSLVALDLSDNDLGETRGGVLLARAGLFAHLESFDLSRNGLSLRLVKALHGALPRLKALDQRDPSPWSPSA